MFTCPSQVAWKLVSHRVMGEESGLRSLVNGKHVKSASRRHPFNPWYPKQEVGKRVPILKCMSLPAFQSMIPSQELYWDPTIKITLIGTPYGVWQMSTSTSQDIFSSRLFKADWGLPLGELTPKHILLQEGVRVGRIRSFFFCSRPYASLWDKTLCAFAPRSPAFRIEVIKICRS